MTLNDQRDLWWRTHWRLRCAANPRIKAVNMALAEWHKRNDDALRAKPSNVVQLFPRRRQAE